MIFWEHSYSQIDQKTMNAILNLKEWWWKCYVRFIPVTKAKYCIQIMDKGSSYYGKLEKAVYGTIIGAILFYNKLSQQLEDWGFKKNNYDECT